MSQLSDYLVFFTVYETGYPGERIKEKTINTVENEQCYESVFVETLCASSRPLHRSLCFVSYEFNKNFGVRKCSNLQKGLY